LAVFFQTNIEMDAVGPQIDVLLPFEGPSVPLLEFFLPDGLQPRNRRGAEAFGPRADQSGQGFAEVARADPLEVQPGNEFFEGARLPQIRRQNLRGESLASRSAAIQHTGLLNLHRTNARDDRPLRQVAVANDLAAASGVL